MEREIATGVLAIQRCMAQASPRSWRDGIVVDAVDGSLELALLDGTTVQLHVIGAELELSAGEPVAWHPVAEIPSAGSAAATARIAA